MTGVHASARVPELRSGNLNTHAVTSQRHNPRRTPPRDTKLVPGNKRQKLSHSPENAEASPGIVPQLKSQDSGSDQSASHWFDSVNQHVPHSAQQTNVYDDEPPFFMSNQNSYLSNTLHPSEAGKLFGVQSRFDNENEELRGVIDDLTIENRRLKQVLRFNQRSQRNSPSTDGQDKLFEVRMTGLSSDKRRELEFLLKNFATSVHTSAPSVPNSNAGSGVSSNSLAANNAGKAKTDSGYASNSNFGQPLSLPSQNTRGAPGGSQSAMDKNIKNYLHDIPDTLMPRQQPIVMSERARMALVVRRLEQLFTGKNATPGEHSQPLQQQEVSQLAAWADAKNNKKRKTEGSREAHILPPDSKLNFDAIEADPEKRKRPALKTSDSDMSVSEGWGSSASRPGTPDQRPTRPLDLDIHRAQVAAENIQYIKHLGFSSPQIEASNTDHPWMYLNLLVNMAQLHTINVTPEFVRRSIKRLSTKFELSKDGHRVRWTGGPEGTVFSREEEKALVEIDNNKDDSSTVGSNEDTGTGSSSKRSKTDSNSNALDSHRTNSEDKTSGLHTSTASKQHISTGATSNQLSSLQTKPNQSSSVFDYKPIVYRERMRDLGAEESYLQDSDSSIADTSRDSSGLVHALSRSNLNQQRKADEGLITFYNNPFFCSDYSGDKMPHNMLPERDAAPGFVLGTNANLEWEGQPSRLAKACYFTPQFGPAPIRPSQDEKLPNFDFVPLSMEAGEEVQPIELNATGLGGVVPDDNFAIDVEINMLRIPLTTQGRSIGRVPHTGTDVRARYKYERECCNKLDLLPSRLPAPSYTFFTTSSSSGNQGFNDDSSVGSDAVSSSADDDEAAPSPSGLQLWSGNASGEMDVDDDDQDDSSMDMLAVARAADPARIAEQERQYMINQPGGRAVAGSLAATVGASRSSSSASDVDIDSNKPEGLSEGEDESDMDVDD